MKASSVLSIATVVLLVACDTPEPQPRSSTFERGDHADPLPSWNDGPTKQAILHFVEATTTKGSPDLVPFPERIAVFDNDGTLWSEAPMPPQLAFVFSEIRRRAPN